MFIELLLLMLLLLLLFLVLLLLFHQASVHNLNFSMFFLLLSGIDQFGDDMEKMTGKRPSIFFRICWKFVCPILLLVCDE